MNLNKDRKFSPEEIENNFTEDFALPICEWSTQQTNAFKAIVEIAYLNHLHSNRPVAYGSKRIQKIARRSGYYYFISTILPVVQGCSYTHRLSTYFTLDKLIQICEVSSSTNSNKNRLKDLIFQIIESIAGNHPVAPFRALILHSIEGHHVKQAGIIEENSGKK